MGKATEIILVLLLSMALILGTVYPAFAVDENADDLTPVILLSDSGTPGTDTQPLETSMDSIASAQEPEAETDSEPEPEPNTVYSEAELTDWLSRNTEGTVNLGCSITITETAALRNLVTINTGEYGLVFAKAYLYEAGTGAHITGAGVDTPVVELAETVFMHGGDWNNIMRYLNITATGRDGLGGTALRISASNVGSLETNQVSYKKPGKIRAYGTGAIGLELMVPFDVYGFDVAVDGEGAVAVSAREGGSLHFCQLSASNGGVSAQTDSGKLLLYTCAASPLPEQGGVSMEQAALSDFSLYYPIKRGSNWDGFYRDITRNQSRVPLKSSAANSKLNTLFVDWDESELNAVELDALGCYEVSGTFLAELYCYWFLRLLPDFDWPAILQVDVRDPAVPCIYNVQFYTRDDGVAVAKIILWEMEQELLDRQILWHSDDGGETWYDCTGAPEVTWWENTATSIYANNISIELSCISEGTLFQVELPGVGESNLVLFTFADGSSSGKYGGDRIGTDRMIGAKPGPVNSGSEEEPAAPHSDSEHSDDEDDSAKRGSPASGGDNVKQPPASTDKSNDHTLIGKPHQKPTSLLVSDDAEPSPVLVQPAAASQQTQDQGQDTNPQEREVTATQPQNTSTQDDEDAPSKATTPPPQQEALPVPEPGFPIRTAVAVLSVCALGVTGGWLWQRRLRATKR